MSTAPSAASLSTSEEPRSSNALQHWQGKVRCARCRFWWRGGPPSGHYRPHPAGPPRSEGADVIELGFPTAIRLRMVRCDQGRLPAVPLAAWPQLPLPAAGRCWPPARPADDPLVLFHLHNPLAQPGHGKAVCHQAAAAGGRRPWCCPISRWRRASGFPTDRHRRRARSGAAGGPHNASCPRMARSPPASRGLHLSASSTVTGGLRACASNSKSAWAVVGSQLRPWGPHRGVGLASPARSGPPGAPMGADWGDRGSALVKRMQAASAAWR